MTVDFPAIHPTSCSFTPPRWPITESVSQAGVRSYRVWANKPSDALLDLQFNNISEASAEAIMTAYTSSRSGLDDLSIPAIIFSGIQSQPFIDLLSQSETGLKWYFVYDNPPVVERVPGRRYVIRVLIRAELRYQ